MFVGVLINPNHLFWDQPRVVSGDGGSDCELRHFYDDFGHCLKSLSCEVKLGAHHSSITRT